MEKKAKNIISIIQVVLSFINALLAWTLKSNMTVSSLTTSMLLFGGLSMLGLTGIRALDDNFSK